MSRFQGHGMQYEPDFILSSTGNGFIEHEMDERILLSVNVRKTASQPSINVVVRGSHKLVIHTCH